jgi:hypothetical protein
VDLPGDSHVQKLEAWAQQQHLLMDFDVRFAGFTSEIRSFTFWNPKHFIGYQQAAPSGGAEDSSVSTLEEVAWSS